MSTPPTFLRIKNSCSNNIWPVIQSKPSSPQLSNNNINTGFSLRPGEAKTVVIPPGWSGFVWGRTLCTYSLQGQFSCVTGDCGSSTTMECPSSSSTSSTVPLTTTLAIFNTMGMGDGQLTYLVSVATGYNLPMVVVPKGRRGRDCRSIGCTTDLNKKCPQVLRVMHEDECVGCNMVDCQAQLHEDYCSGLTGYLNFFQGLCPLAHSSSSSTNNTFACLSADVDLTFCANDLQTTRSSTGKKEENEKSYDGKQKKNIVIILVMVGSSMGVMVFGCSCVLVIRRRREQTHFNQSQITTTTTDHLCKIGCSC
ncbi:hypothetical protein CsatB_024279 [Cannabis sativa]